MEVTNSIQHSPSGIDGLTYHASLVGGSGFARLLYEMKNGEVLSEEMLKVEEVLEDFRDVG